MARLPRIIVPGIPLHIIQRGNNRQATFFSEEDYHRYLDVLKTASEEYACSIHAYVLMTNHIHLLVTPETEDSVSLMMQAIGRKYVRYINGTYQRSDTLWEGRFKSALVEIEQYFLTCSRYIELNPVRAGIVDFPEEYKWSSYCSNALGVINPYLTKHDVYLRLSESDLLRQKAYKALFRSHIDAHSLEVIRNSTQKNTVMGGSRFEEEIERVLKCRVKRFEHGGDRKSSEFTA